MFPILALIVLIPFLSIIPILFLGKRGIMAVQVAASAVVLALAIYLIYLSNIGVSTQVSYTYLPSIGLNLGLTTTPISLILILMSAIVFMGASLVFSTFIKERQKAYGVLFALVQGSAIALFLSSNLLLFYIFWEIAEFAMFFMILTHGSENRRHAAIKFIAYSIASSLALLLGILVLYSAAHTFDIAALAQSASLLSTQTQLIALVLFLFAFMIKIPIFPFHNWLPEAHTQAPTTGSMILAGVMLKFGGYGLIILAGILPIMFHYSLYLFALFAFSSIFSALVIARQNNLKKAIAYSSITEMAIVGVGILANTQQALTGATYLMLAHAISVSILFLAAGIVNESYGTLEIKSLNGITRNFRRLTYLFIFGAFAAIGIPLTAGFIGDILTFVGSYTTFGLLGLVPLAAILILGGIFFWILESVFMSGEGSVPVKQIEKKAYIAGVFLAVCAVLLGVLPFLVI